MTDEELLAVFRSNPNKGFRPLYDRYAGGLLRYIYRFTGDQQQSEDILHDVFTELLKHNFQTLTGESFKNWLFTLAKNKSLNAQRRRQRETSSELLEDLPAPTQLEEQTSLSQLLNKLSILEKSLPKDLLETWQLRRSGLDYQQIATQLEIPIGTVKSRFHRLVQFMKKELEL